MKDTGNKTLKIGKQFLAKLWAYKDKFKTQSEKINIIKNNFKNHFL